MDDTAFERRATELATELWLAACKLQDAGPLSGIDVGLALCVRDKLDTMLAEHTQYARTARHYEALAAELKERS